MTGVSVSFGVAFLAGLVSFLSPCVLPLVPSYITFVTGMTLDELTVNGTASARRRAALHALLFVVGFSLVFVTLGWYLAGARRLSRWLRRVEIASGVLLVVVGVLMFTGRFASLSAYLAGFGQLITLRS